MKTAIKRTLGAACESGIGQRITRWRPGRFAVLMFHRVVDESTLRGSANHPLMMAETLFADMARTLAETCLCLPLEAALERSRNGPASAKPMVAVTFDDGYADFADKAFPVLERFAIPSTVYLSTGPMDDPAGCFWWDAVAAYCSGPVDPAESEGLGLPEVFLLALRALAASPMPAAVRDFIRGPMYRLDPAARKAFVALAARRLANRPAMLGWDQVRSLAGTGLVDFGAHTVNHPFLDEIPFDEAVEEVRTSKLRIETETDQAVTSFAYPAGRVPPFHREMLHRAGLSVAVTTRPGSNNGHGDATLLRRLDARRALLGDLFDPSYFTAVCRGCLDWLHAIREA